MRLFTLLSLVFYVLAVCLSEQKNTLRARERDYRRLYESVMFQTVNILSKLKWRDVEVILPEMDNIDTSQFERAFFKAMYQHGFTISIAPSDLFSKNAIDVPVRKVTLVEQAAPKMFSNLTFKDTPSIYISKEPIDDNVLNRTYPFTKTLLVGPMKEISDSPLTPSTDVFSMWWEKNVYTGYFKKLDWQTISGNRFQGLCPNMMDLHNQQLTVTTVWMPDQRITKKPAKSTDLWGGYVFEIINTLMTKLNFRYIVVRAPDDTYGSPFRNGSWSGMLGMLQRKEADLTAADITASELRDTVVDFTPSIYDDAMSFITLAPGLASQDWILMKPFTIEIWALFTISILVSSAVLCLIVYLHNKWIPFDSNQEKQSLHSTLDMVIRVALMQGLVQVPKIKSCLVILSTWSLMMVVLAYAYSGSLVASVSIKDWDRPLDSLEDLLTHSNLKLGAMESSLQQLILQHSTTEIHTLAWERMKDSLFTPGENTMKRILTQVKKDKIAYVSEEFFLKKLRHESSVPDEVCTLHIAKEYMWISTWNIAIQDASPLLEPFSKVIKQLRQAGFLQHWELKHEMAGKRHSCFPAERGIREGLKPLSLKYFIAPFYFLFGGLILSLMVLALEILINIVSHYNVSYFTECVSI
ncbi:putative glutamate receptor [Tachypleus tridentatus]|uniref:putative glutamate receptor n=1 Tax=Tachypleus tridentatus TaxID=6853 RepID=UPI003FD2D5F8